MICRLRTAAFEELHDAEARLIGGTAGVAHDAGRAGDGAGCQLAASNAHELRRGSSVLPAAVKEAVRGILAPVVRLAIALHLTPNTITVIGLLITVVAAVLVGGGWLLVGAAVLTAGSLLDAVDGALARAQGGGTAFGSFLDSTLDRASEAILYVGIAVWFLDALAGADAAGAGRPRRAGRLLPGQLRARARGGHRPRRPASASRRAPSASCSSSPASRLRASASRRS